MFKLNDMFFYEMIENLNCQGCWIWQPIDKKHWQTEVLYLLCVLKYFKSNETCLLWNFSKKCKVERSKCLVQGHNMQACTGFELMTLGSWVRSFNTRGVSTLVSVGTCRWKFESGPIFIPNFPKILTNFYTKNLDFRQNLTQFFEIFRNFWKFFNPKFMKFGQLGDKFEEILKSDPSLYKLCNWKRGRSYTRRPILRPISAARPHTHFCTKNPPGFNTLNLYALWWKFPCQLYRILHLASQNMYLGVS